MEKIYNLQNNQIVYESGSVKKFFSYGTLIATVDEEKRTLTLTAYYDYSKTTSKWLKVFLNDRCNIYYKNAKELRDSIGKSLCNYEVFYI